MSDTAISAGAGDGERSKNTSSGVEASAAFDVHKPGEGYATRLGMMVVCIAYVGFACHCWYYNWVFVRDVFDGFFGVIHLGVLTRWMSNPTPVKFLAIGGVIAIAAIGFSIAYYYIYCKRRTAEFLVKTDSELSKVNWPAVTPWFKPEAKVWGATYVVLIFTGLLALYVFGVDSLLNLISQWSFYP